jgi:hypothetical protein
VFRKGALLSIATVKETAESRNRILALIITLGTVTKHQLASLVNSTPDQVDEILGAIGIQLE